LIGARKLPGRGHLGVQTSLRLTLESLRTYEKTAPPGARPMPSVRESGLTILFEDDSEYFVDCAAIKRLASPRGRLEQLFLQLQATVACH
jgi:hypothetical protein